MTLRDHSSWWSRPCGGRDVVRLALPLVISMASWTVMNFTNRMFLFWHSTDAMAAILPSGTLFYALLCFPLGVVGYVGTFVAQYHGAGRPERIGLVVWQAVGICLLTIPLMTATIPLAPWLFTWAGHDPSVTAHEVTYYQVVTWSSGGLLLSTALSAAFAGMGRARVVMIVDTVGALMNMVLDYLLIFGHGGFPEMGVVGAAWATTASQWLQVALYWGILYQPASSARYQLLAGRRYDPALMRRLWRYGGPNGLQMLLEVAAFAVFLLFVGRLGEEAMAATTLAFNVNSVAFVPMMGVGMAVTTIVGQQLGRKRPDLAARAAWTGFWIAEAFMGTMAVAYVVWPDAFLVGHAWGSDPEQFLRVRDLTVILLQFVAAYCIFDAMNVIFVAAIKGAGDTRFILTTAAALSPLPVAAAWWGMAFCGWGILWCWVVLTVWCCALGATYFARFLQGRWRSMQVIEPSCITDAEAVADGAALHCAV